MSSKRMVRELMSSEAGGDFSTRALAEADLDIVLTELDSMSTVYTTQPATVGVEKVIDYDARITGEDSSGWGWIVTMSIQYRSTVTDTKALAVLFIPALKNKTTTDFVF